MLETSEGVETKWVMTALRISVVMVGGLGLFSFGGILRVGYRLV